MVYVKDEFGGASTIVKASFEASVGGIPNHWGIAVTGCQERVNNLVIKGKTPILWDWDPVIVHQLKQPVLSVVQLAGENCTSVKMALSAES